LPKTIEVFAVISASAKIALELERNTSISNNPNITFYEDSSIGACIASGSFKTDAMIILPCSMNTLAKCSVGISDTLITRAFSVMLKEKRKIILAPREMPYNTIRKYGKIINSKCGDCSTNVGLLFTTANPARDGKLYNW
jgi:4-hydroxy-3-polyprenylbenzoate decarboxylase